MTRHIRQLIALVGLLALLMSLAPPHVASAAAGPLAEDEAVKLLQSYTIVRGDPSGALHLDERLTRAQAATIFVRAVGAEAQAKNMAGQVPFGDAAGHWAAGEIALANALGLMRGDGNGTFRPESDITYAEVLTVLLRIVGREPSGPWSADRIMLAAGDLDIAPSGSQQNQPAIRGKIFWSLATAVSRIPLATGETVLKKYIDSTPPQLTLNQSPTSTVNNTVTISGQATGAATVMVGDQTATLSQTTGQFTATVTLDYGSNRIVVEAVDYAGNRSSSTVNVERQASVSRIEISGDALIRTGTRSTLKIEAFDRLNNPVPIDDLEAVLTGDVATFDQAKSALVTTTKLGRGTLTLSSGSVRKSYSFTVVGPSTKASQLIITQINGGHAPLPGKETTVKVQVADSTGRLVGDDYFRTITLDDSGLSGVTVKPSSVQSEAGVATFTVSSTREGEASLVARSSGLDSATASLQFLPAPRVVLTTTTSTLKADGTSTLTVRAVLEDENGNAKTNTTGSDIRVTLTRTGTDAELTDDSVVIRQGASSSTDNGVLRAGVTGGTLKISGTYDSSHTYPMQALTIPVTGGVGAVKLQVVGPTSTTLPGRTASVSVRVLDGSGNLVRVGSYAFQLAITTDNGEEIVNGLPAGVTLTFPSSDLSPIDDGKRDSDPDNVDTAIIGRTYQGTADLRLTYEKSGTVTLTPKLLSTTQDAFHPTLGFGPAASTVSMEKEAADVLFVGTAAGLKVSVDSDLGIGLPGGAVNSAETIDVAVQVVDADGVALPRYSGTITLTRSASSDHVTRFSGSTADRSSKSATTGQAPFEIQATSTEGYDVYTASSSGLPSVNFTVSVRKTKAQVPDIVGVYGVKEGGVTPVLGQVAPDDDYLEIVLANQVPPGDGEPTYWVSANVYRKGETGVLMSDIPVDLHANPPVIRIPKAKLTRAGTATYQVTINNGAGDTQRSPDDGRSTAVNALYSTTYKLTSGLFDAASGKLTLTTTGLASTGTFDPGKLHIVKGTNKASLDDMAVEVVSVGTTSVVLRSDDLKAALDPEVFNGEVTIEAEDGWFRNADGSQISRGTDSAILKPMAVITHAMIDLTSTTKRLYLYGYGFDQGTVYLESIRIGGVALRPGSGSSYDQQGTKTATQVPITLSRTTLDAITALQGTSIPVTADVGWLRAGSGTTVHQAGAITGDTHRLYTKVTVTSAPYTGNDNTITLRGSGFAGSTLDPSKLSFKVGSTTRRLDAQATATTVDDDTIEIHLGDVDAGYFESSSGFRGKTVYLNTDEGWLESAQGLWAMTLPTNTVKFIPNP